LNTILYTCPICLKNYNNPDEAQRCLDIQIDKGGDFQPGEWVLCPGAFHGWYYRPEWLALTVPAMPGSGDHFETITNYHAWYVVTAVVPKPRYHEAVVHVATGAYGDANKLHVGWTTPYRRFENGKPTHKELFRPDELQHAGDYWRIPRPHGVPSQPTDPRVLAAGAEAAKAQLHGSLL